MTKLSFALLLASALSLGALSAAPAGADTRAGAASSTFAARRDTPHCVTKREWRRVYIVPDGTGRGPGKGGTKARVHRIFDVRASAPGASTMDTAQGTRPGRTTGARARAGTKLPTSSTGAVPGGPTAGRRSAYRSSAMPEPSRSELQLVDLEEPGPLGCPHRVPVPARVPSTTHDGPADPRSERAPTTPKKGPNPARNEQPLRGSLAGAHLFGPLGTGAVAAMPTVPVQAQHRRVIAQGLPGRLERAVGHGTYRLPGVQ